MKINNGRNWKQFLKRIRGPLLIVILFVVVYLFNTQVARLAVVSGESMYPTLLDNDILLVNQLNYEPTCGDIILIDVQESPLQNEYIVKRIIAVAGDTISIGLCTSAYFRSVYAAVCAPFIFQFAVVQIGRLLKLPNGLRLDMLMVARGRVYSDMVTFIVTTVVVLMLILLCYRLFCMKIERRIWNVE